jgi:hypothetical protein
VALALIGPCMIAAPLVAVAFVVAIPLWPVAVVLSLAGWALAASLEWLGRLVGIDALNGWGVAMWRLLRTILTPWTYFDPPKKD